MKDVPVSMRVTGTISTMLAILEMIVGIGAMFDGALLKFISLALIAMVVSFVVFIICSIIEMGKIN